MKKTVRRKKKVKKAAPKGPTLMDRLPKNEIERLELMIRMTEKHIDPRGVDTTMANQADRLRKQLEELKSKS